MIWLAVLALSALTLLPLAVSLRRRVTLRDRRGAALALHRAQLAELSRERDADRLRGAEYDAAVLEVQRRLLAADVSADSDGRAAPGMPVGTPVGFPLAVLFPLVPLLALVLYVPGLLPYLDLGSGMPGMEAQPLAERKAVAALKAAEDAALVDALRQRLTGIDPRSAQGRQGYVLLGNAEAQRGHMREAAAAWRIALDAGFDPTVAVMTGAAIMQAEGKVTTEAAALFRRALAEGPVDAPWRAMVERRLQELPP